MSDLEANLSRLLELASAGDEQAIADLLARYESEILLVARRQLGSSLRPYLDSMDLAQSISEDLFLGLREGKFSIEHPRQLLALVTRLIRWKAAKHWRKHRRQQRLSGVSSPIGGLADVIISLQSDDNPEAGIEEAEQINLILGQLNPADRELVTLRLEGYSTAEAARVLGANSDALRVRLSRLRKRLTEIKVIADLL